MRREAMKFTTSSSAPSDAALRSRGPSVVAQSHRSRVSVRRLKGKETVVGLHELVERLGWVSNSADVIAALERSAVGAQAPLL